MSVDHWKDEAFEQRLRATIALDEPWRLIETFQGLVRETGTEDERRAADTIVERLKALGVPHEVYRPTLFISLPRAASVTVRSAAGTQRISAKTVAMSIATEGITAPLQYVPTGYAKGIGSLFETSTVDIPLQGCIAVTEGLPMPAKVKQMSDRGAVAAIFVSPGDRIHEGICTTIWGAPDLDNFEDQPRLAVAELSRGDGMALIEATRTASEAGTPLTATVTTELETGWVPCPVVVAEIRGSQDPDRFVLLHGHIDSWHQGIGDNATGDATLLELARVFHEERQSLRRSLRIAWWPGHSTGRYAGSTWYADAFAHDLRQNAIASVNCDSPGCRFASEYRDLTTMRELFDVTAAAIADATGLKATWARPSRAGDYSFNNLGLPATLMLSSTMPEEVAAEKGYYAVGGCGGNIAWHTEDDLLQIADRDVLLRDMRMYATVVARLLNAPVYPIDLTGAVSEFTQTLADYQQAAAGSFRFGAAEEALDGLRDALERFNDRAQTLVQGGAEAGDAVVEALNEGLRHASRQLVRINYARRDTYRQDPALEVPPLPDLAAARELPDTPLDSHRGRVLLTHLMRGQNRVVGAIGDARREIELSLARSHGRI